MLRVCVFRAVRSGARSGGHRRAGWVIGGADGTLTGAADRSRARAAECPTCAVGTEGAGERVREGQAELRRRLRLAGLSGLLLVGAAAVGWLGPAAGLDPPRAEVLAAVMYVASAVLGGWLVAGKAFRALRSRAVNFEVLVVVAAAGAAAIGDLPEAALVVFLFSVGESLEAAGVSRTRRAIGALLDLVPRRALVRRGGVEEEVPAEEVAVGETVVIRPGERFPVDGRVLSGRSFVDQAPITGESMPVPKGPGDEVFAGSVNGQGSLEVVSTRRAEDTTLARIIHLVEEAEREKAGHQKTIDRFAAAYTPVVTALAVAVAVVPPLVLGGPFGPYVYRALALLLVACPCALVLSTPVAVVAAIGRAARRGVLIKGGSALEAAGRVRAVAFDKTGTLTAGRPEVSDIVASDGLTEEGVLRLAAAVEWRSEHPVAGAIRREAARRGLVPAGGGSAGSGPSTGFAAASAAGTGPPAAPPEVRNIESIPGRGAKARVEGRNHYVGSRALFERDLGVPPGPLAPAARALEERGNTVVYVGTSDRVLGLIAVSDTVREEAAEAVEGLRRAGVGRLYLLTGDNPATASSVAERLGLDGYRAELSPEDKAAAVRTLAAETGPLAMVGDGVNDAPALAAASVGIAMGAAGTDQAIEAADIALMDDDLRQVSFALRLGRRTVGVIRQNIGLALGVKAAALVLAAAGLLPLWLAVLADTGNTVLVIANALRLLGGRE